MLCTPGLPASCREHCLGAYAFSHADYEGLQQWLYCIYAMATDQVWKMPKQAIRTHCDHCVNLFNHGRDRQVACNPGDFNSQ